MLTATIPLIPFSATRFEPQVTGSAEPAIIGLILGGGDDEALCYQIFEFLETRPRGRVRLHIIATEPGPVSLANGLRLLPNEFLPNITLPDILIFSRATIANPDFNLLALLRRCLEAGRPVLVVGGQFPAAFADLPLEPGQVIGLRPAASVGVWLRRQFDEMDRQQAADPYPVLPDP